MMNEITGKTLFTGFAVVCFFCCLKPALGQQVQTITDKRDILIGGQIKLNVKATIPPGAEPVYTSLIIPDSIPHFELVDPGKADTIEFKDNSRAIEQTITLTSFDSGRWVFPALPVEILTGQSGQRLILQTDSFYVNVSYSPPDSTNQLRDIKPIIQVRVTSYFWYYVAAGILILLLTGYLLYRYVKKRKRESALHTVSKLPAFDEAMEELKKLEELNLQVADEVKLYHTRLAGIFKKYLGRKLQANLLPKTTGDILITARQMDVQGFDIAELATILRCTDAVKFAKYIPPTLVSDDNRQKITHAIQVIEENFKNLTAAASGKQGT